MKNLLSLICFVLPALAMAQQDSIISGVYEWKEPKKQSKETIRSSVLFQGKAHDLEWLQVSANQMRPSKTKTGAIVPANEEHLIIIKSGHLSIDINNATHKVGAGSVSLLMPGERITLRSEGPEPCKYYLMKYRSKAATNIDRGRAAGGSLVKAWNDVEFKPHDKGGRRDFFERPTAMFRRLEIHVTTLKESIKSHDPHTHKAEEIVLVIDGKTEMQIGDKFYKGGEGSIYYLGSSLPHALQNIGNKNTTYFAIQFD